MKISGNIVDILGRRIFPGEITLEDGCIKKISKLDRNFSNYILPGLVDSHVHIESSMLTPADFQGWLFHVERWRWFQIHMRLQMYWVWQGWSI